MGMPGDVGIIDCMIGFPAEDFAMYDFIREQLKDGSDEFDFPVEYMFKQVPKEIYGSKDPISVTLGEMDKHGIEVGVIGVGGDVSRKALQQHPDRFAGQGIFKRREPVGADTEYKGIFMRLDFQTRILSHGLGFDGKCDFFKYICCFCHGLPHL